MILFHSFDSKNISSISTSFKSQIEILDSELNDQKWNHKIWSETWVEFNNFFLYFYEEGGIVKAFSLWTCPIQEETMHLLKIVVEEGQRKHGLGKKLMESVFELNPSKGIYLEVLVKNAGAVAFYKQLGLKIMTRTRDYYGTGLDAYKMYRASLISN